MERSVTEKSSNLAVNTGNAVTIPQLDVKKTPMEYLRVVRERMWSIFFLTISVGIITVILVSSMQPVYRAAAILQIEPKTKQLSSIDDIYGNNTFSREYFKTQLTILQSRSLLHQVALFLGMDKGVVVSAPAEKKSTRFDWKQYLPDQIADLLLLFFQLNVVAPEPSLDMKMEEVRLKGILVQKIAGSLDVKPVRGSGQLVEISYESTDPEEAANVPNTLVKVFIRSGFQTRQKVTSDASTWFSNRLDVLRQKLRESEQNLRKFQEQNNLLDTQSGGGLVAKRFEEVYSDLRVARGEQKALKTLYDQITNTKKRSLNELISIPEILSDSVVGDRRLVLIEKEQEVVALAQRYGPKHPKMIAAISARNSARSSLRKQVDTKIKSIQNQYKQISNTVYFLERQYNKTKGELQKTNQGNSRLSELRSDVEANRKLYNLFLSRVKESDAIGEIKSDNTNVVNARLIDPAEIPLFPYKPNKKRIVLIAFFAAFVVGILLVLLVDLLDNTIKSVNDVEAKLQTSLLGVVPLIGKSKYSIKKHNLDMLFLSDANNHFSEAIRTIRTAIRLTEVDNVKKIIAITSTAPQEGKSTVSMNLALAMSPMEKVLLIDCDLRRPSVAKFLGLGKKAPGLVNLISKTAEPKDCFYKVEGSSLVVLPAGDLPPNPQELLSSERFKLVLKKLSDGYDRIIIDCTPSQIISDSFIVGALANTVIFVCQANAVPVPVIRSTLARFHQANLPLVGVVLNKITAKHRNYYSSYGRYGGYGGYGGYGSYGSYGSYGGEKKS
ncbi:MAG: polysaccharide biosynthesis tyrosine autokinase [Magnetococcales bacterium]|nr:polysaccharide biosynthesis tyrosine autokinase [Magnetococcales bacterium]